MKIIYFGTPQISARVLEDILQDGRIEVVACVSQADKPSGRNQEISPTPTKKVAQKYNIPCHQPDKIKNNAEFLETLKGYDADHFLVLAYGKILPASVLEIPRKGCINIHGSLLPKYRGASPIQAALLNGDKQTGVTLMYMNEKMDEGDVITTQNVPISTDETSGSLFEKFAEVSGPFAIQGLLDLDAGKLQGIPQDHSQATYSGMINKEDGLLNVHQSAQESYQHGQAYTPWPGLFFFWKNKRIVIEKARVAEGSGKAGAIIQTSEGKIGIQHENGVLLLRQIKPEGKKSMDIKDFVNGNADFVGSSIDDR